MTIGIYAIINGVNKKRYIGKSKNIEKRIGQHFLLMNKDTISRSVNRHLFWSAKKHGIENFYWEVLEGFESVDESLLADREIFWMEKFNTTDRDFGYNLVKDSSSKVIVHEETREIFKKIFIGENNPNFGNFWTDEQKSSMSQIAKHRHSSGLYYGDSWREKISERSKELWKDEDKKREMAESVSASRTSYFIQKMKDGTVIAVWQNINQILHCNPGYKWQNIYAACNGSKKRYRGFLWERTENIPHGFEQLVKTEDFNIVPKKLLK